MLIKVDTVLHTNGKGYWSKHAKAVPVTGLELSYVNDARTFGDLRVHFDETVWSIRSHDLIYTDPLFLKELRNLLKSIGIKGGRGVDYSEHGLQGRDYVSLDVGTTFIKSFKSMINNLTHAKPCWCIVT